MSTQQVAVSSARTAIARAGRPVVAALLTALLLSACGDNPDDLVAAARKDIEKKDYRTAVLQLKTALQKDANHKDARYALGVALRETGDMAGAEKELRRALELGFDPGATKLELARAVYGQGKLDDFIKEFGSIQLPTPQANADLKGMIGNSQFARGKVDEASASFDEALKLVPGHVTGRLGQARVLAARGDVPGAEAIITEVLGKSPKERDALTLQAAITHSRGEHDKAIAIQRKLVEYFPTEVHEHYMLSTRLMEAGKMDDAKAAIEAMVKVAPVDPRTYHAQAMLAYQSKDYAAAQQHAIKALSRAPAFVPAQLIAGAASVQLRSYQQGIQYLTSVVKVQKRNLFAQQLLVAAFMGAGETQRASRALKEALELFPNDSRLLLLAGEVSARDRKVSDAAKYFELSAEKGESSGLASLRLGQALLAEGKESEGLRVLEESAKSSGGRLQSEITLVSHHMSRGEFDKAGKWIDAIEKKEPKSAIAPTLRGLVLLRKRDVAGARKEFETAHERDSGAVPALNYLARMDLASNKAADAKARYAKAAERNPKNEQLVVDYARLLRATGEKPEVVNGLLEKLIKDLPGAETARMALIESALANRDGKQAVVVAREAVAAVPASINLKMALGRALQMSGDNNQAISVYADVLKAQPRFMPAMVSLAQTFGTVGDFTKSIETVDRALEIAPGNIDLTRLKVLGLVRSKQNERALTVARELRNKQPKIDAGYELEASVLAAMEKWSEAADLLQIGQKEVPSPRMLIRLHAALTQGGKAERARQVASEWLTANPKDLQIRAYLAERATAAGNHEVAVRYYKEAVAVAPKSALLLNNLAWSADKIKDPKALSYAEEANTLAPNSPAIQDTLGWLLVQKGDTARGVELLEKASKGAPQTLSIRYNYAQALIKAGRKDDARKELDFLKSQGDRFLQHAELDQLYKQL